MAGMRSRTEREDFRATSDPALNEAADRTSKVKLLTYGELYLLWERQQWQTQELDFSRDREDWHERIPP
jgi:ribonucleoside-diphosphate reductase beta chain